MWTTTATLETDASPAAVFALWSDVPGWPAWDASLVSTTLGGPFAVGTAGTLHPQGAPEPLPFTLTAVEEGVGFSDETGFGPIVLRFHHRVEALAGGGARISVTVEAEGPDADQVGPAVAEDLPESLVALAAAASGHTLRA